MVFGLFGGKKTPKNPNQNSATSPQKETKINDKPKTVQNSTPPQTPENAADHTRPASNDCGDICTREE